jgi:hypothetical protein
VESTYSNAFPLVHLVHGSGETALALYSRSLTKGRLHTPSIWDFLLFVFSLLYLPFSKGKEEHERKIPNEDVEVNYKRSMHRREGR